MALAKQQHVNLSLDTVFEEIPRDVWLGTIGEQFETPEIVCLRAVSKSLQDMMSDDELWLQRMSVLVLEHPVLTDLAKSPKETTYDWYKRCHIAIDNGCRLARRHKDGEQPYLKLYGAVDGNTFTPFMPLRFPIPAGLIAELVALEKRAKRSADPVMDAAMRFPGMPNSFVKSMATRCEKIRGALKSAYLPRSPDNGGTLPDLLEQLYRPESKAADAPERAACCTLDVLQRRLGRATCAKSRADREIISLKAEYEQKLREKDEIIARQAATIERQAKEIAALKSELRAERARRVEAEREAERRPTADELAAVQAKLDAERKAKRAADRVIAAMKKELAKVRAARTLADRAYDEAEERRAAAKAAMQGAMKGAMREEAAAAARVAAADRNAAAQVAAAQMEMEAWMEAALDEAVAAEIASRGLMTEEEMAAALDEAVAAEVASRSLMTEEQMVERAREQAAAGSMSTPFRRAAAITMDSECSSAGSSTSLPSTSARHGRGATYLRIVGGIRPADRLSPRQLRHHGQMIMKQIERVGGSEAGAMAVAAQMINGNRSFFKGAIKFTFLKPPKPLTLSGQLALRKEMSGALYDEVISYMRRECGVKTEATRKEVIDTFKECAPPIWTSKWTVTREKEIKIVENGNKKTIKKKVEEFAACFWVQSLMNTINELIDAFDEAGLIEYGGNVPADVFPVVFMCDGGGGSFKVCAKFPCVKNADSVRHIALLGMFTGVKDTVENIEMAFDRRHPEAPDKVPLLEQIRNLSEEQHYVICSWSPKEQQMPKRRRRVTVMGP